MLVIIKERNDMPDVLLGVFADRRHAEMAIADLKDAGYDPKEISIVMTDQGEAQQVQENTGANVVTGAAEGAVAGGAIGGLAGLLIGIGAIAIPGLGAVFIAGPLAAALGLTGAAATTVSGATTGALAGGLIGALVGLGIPRETAQLYEERVREGGLLLAVPVREGTDAEAIMRSHGADQFERVEVDSYALQ
jgi:hypothetical protein